jgi:hypothetical protein
MERILAFLTPFTDTYRHWSPQGEKYTGLDSLISAVFDGWMLSDRVFRHETWRGGARPVTVYYFELKRDQKIVTMPVINNPCVVPLIEQFDLQVVTQTFWERAH